LLLIDERRGQSEAVRRGLSTTGTLGALLDAGEAGLIDPPQAYRRLIEETTFRTSPALEDHFLRRFV
jgi:predicted nucleic acid-binding protein